MILHALEDDPAALGPKDPIGLHREGRADAQRLEPSLVAQWETQWAAAAERLELVGGAGQAYTGPERAAAAQGRLLTQADELPQTLYRVLSSPGSPALISLTLKIAK